MWSGRCGGCGSPIEEARVFLTDAGLLDRGLVLGLVRRARVALCCAALAFSGCVAFGQPALPDVDRSSYSDGDRSRIDAFASWAVGELGGEGYAAARAAVSEASVPGVSGMAGGSSAAFRNELARAVLGDGEGAIRDAIAGEDEARAVNALLLVGSVAHRRSSALLGVGLNDEREAVRAGAAAGAKVMLTRLSVVEGGEPARWARGTQDLLGEALSEESSGVVARSMVQALTATPNDEELQLAGLRRAASAMSSRSRAVVGMGGLEAVDGGWLAAQGKLIGEVRALLVRAGAGASVDRGMLRDAGFVVGASLAIFGDALESIAAAEESGELEGVGDGVGDGVGAGGAAMLGAAGFAEAHADLVGAAEQVGLQAEALLLDRPIGERAVLPELRSWLDAGGEAGRLVRSGVMEGIGEGVGEGGKLTRPPFGFEASAFAGGGSGA